MIVYRITPHKHASDITGLGAAMTGGRWNKAGTPVLYTGENKEIALLETIVHLPLGIIPNLDILIIEIPNDSIKEITKDILPENWTDYPAPTILSEIAEQWVRKKESVALKVPSCIIHSTYNYILSCGHPDYSKIKVLEHKDFHLDLRLKR